jgi:hypothetical protein
MSKEEITKNIEKKRLLLSATTRAIGILEKKPKDDEISKNIEKKRLLLSATTRAIGILEKKLAPATGALTVTADPSAASTGALTVTADPSATGAPTTAQTEIERKHLSLLKQCGFITK